MAHVTGSLSSHHPSTLSVKLRDLLHTAPLLKNLFRTKIDVFLRGKVIAEFIEGSKYRFCCLASLRRETAEAIGMVTSGLSSESGSNPIRSNGLFVSLWIEANRQQRIHGLHLCGPFVERVGIIRYRWRLRHTSTRAF
tara:strand:- start:151 stop:564 length:414 start_codon:yes stop_codon:yes gene_type:complete